MNMHMQTGSCVLVIMTIMSILLMLGIATYKSSTFFHQFALQRDIHEQHVALTHGLLEYGIRVVVDNYAAIADREHPLMLRVDNADFQGTVQLYPDTQKIRIEATVVNHMKKVNCLTCMASKKEDGQLQVWGFQKG